MKSANNIDNKALFKISYGLYVVTTNDGKKDNGLIVNTPIQVTSTPQKVAVTVNKQNYSHDVIKETKIMNVNCLTIETPFSIWRITSRPLSILLISNSPGIPLKQ